MYNGVSERGKRMGSGACMEVYYCGQCRMMIAPQAHFCSVCGSVVHPRRSWVRKTWPHIAWILQRVIAIYVVWVALRIGSPVALIVTPDCVATPARVGLAMRVMGEIQPLVGVVGGESLFVARACTPMPAWYVVGPAPSWVVAMVQRDTTTWPGTLLAVVDQGVATSEQVLITGIRTAVTGVQSFLFDTRTW